MGNRQLAMDKEEWAIGKATEITSIYKYGCYKC